MLKNGIKNRPRPPISPSERREGECLTNFGYRSLFRNEMYKAFISHDAAAAELRVTRQQIGKLVNGKIPLSLAEIERFLKFLEIDPLRAHAAIVQNKDYTAYNSDLLVSTTNIYHKVVDEFTSCRQGNITEEIDSGTAEQLAILVAKTIVDYHHRRNSTPVYR